MNANVIVLYLSLSICIALDLVSYYWEKKSIKSNLKPSGYDSDDDTGITDIRTTVLLEWLHDIEPSENSFKGSVNVFLFWTDERLANLTTKATDLSGSRVWQPSAKLYNLDGNAFELAPSRVRLLPSGEIKAVQSFTIESYCIVESQYYPMDQNICNIFLQFMGNRFD